MRDGADDGGVIGQARQTRQIFGDGDARDARRHRAKLAANLGRSVRFEVQGVEVRGTAVVVEENASLGAWSSPRTAVRGLSVGATFEPIGKEQAGESEPADSQQLAPGDSVAKPNVRPVDGKHARLRDCDMRMLEY